MSNIINSNKYAHPGEGLVVPFYFYLPSIGENIMTCISLVKALELDKAFEFNRIINEALLEAGYN